MRPAIECGFANIDNPQTRRAYENDLRGFMVFAGIAQLDDFRIVTRRHVLAWRKSLEAQQLGGSTIRRKLAALSSLFEHLCESNAVTHNPVKGVKRPAVESQQGKTRVLGDAQARALLYAPDAATLKGKRDRAILSILLFHRIRRAELAKLKLKNYSQTRRAVAHLRARLAGFSQSSMFPCPEPARSPNGSRNDGYRYMTENAFVCMLFLCGDNKFFL
ncbi:Tyrosine recombinase XerC [Nitrosospira sp. NRS527]|nr:Tyrosine recombinase XerC [Nitrosospira sp. NRS527]